MNLRAVTQSCLFAILVLVNGEQLSSATTRTSDLKVSLVIANHCSISTEGASPSVECDGSGVYRVYEQAPFAAVPVSEEETAAAPVAGQSHAANGARQKIEIAF